MYGGACTKFQLPVETVEIFDNEIWVVDIYGGLSLICPNAKSGEMRSKLSKTLSFCHLERRTFKYPIRNIVTLVDLVAILYCNNQCEFFFRDSNNKYDEM